VGVRGELVGGGNVRGGVGKGWVWGSRGGSGREGEQGGATSSVSGHKDI